MTGVIGTRVIDTTCNVSDGLLCLLHSPLLKQSFSAKTEDHSILADVFDGCSTSEVTLEFLVLLIVRLTWIRYNTLLSVVEARGNVGSSIMSRTNIPGYKINMSLSVLHLGSTYLTDGTP